MSAGEGVVRYLWESRHGSMLIETRDGQVFIDGQLVEPAQVAAPDGG